MLALIIITGILVYIFLGGVVGGLWYKYFRKRHGCLNRSWCSVDHEGVAILTGILWPVAPVLTGLIYLLWTSISRGVTFVVDRIIK
jgi:hypothetical protein